MFLKNAKMSRKPVFKQIYIHKCSQQYYSQQPKEGNSTKKVSIRQIIGKQVTTCFCCLLAKSCLTLYNLMDCSAPGFFPCPSLISWSLLKLTFVESVMLFNHPILCQPLLFLHSIFPSINLFSNELALHIKWPKYWSFRFRMSPSNANSGLISFKIVWLELFAVQGALKSLLQHHNSKASILRHSTFFIHT